MPRIVLLLVVAALASFWLAPHRCASYVRTGETGDLTVVEDAYGGPAPGPGVVSIAQCASFDERWPSRVAITLVLAFGVALFGWWNRPQRVPFGEYLSSEY